MLRANIYSLEPLPAETRSALNDGIDMAAAYMGHQLIAKELTVRLPLNEHGNVNPARVGYGKLDRLVELHLMAVPLDPGAGERVGLAGVGRGWGFVDVVSNSPELIRTTTAHETAHAFGFVLPDASQRDLDSPRHCSHDSCVMHKKVTTMTTHHEQFGQANPRRKFLSRLGFSRGERQPIEPVMLETVCLANNQYDFCTDCKISMRDNGEEQIAGLRHNRIFTWKGIR